MQYLNGRVAVVTGGASGIGPYDASKCAVVTHPELLVHVEERTHSLLDEGRR